MRMNNIRLRFVTLRQGLQPTSKKEESNFSVMKYSIKNMKIVICYKIPSRTNTGFTAINCHWLRLRNITAIKNRIIVKLTHVLIRFTNLIFVFIYARILFILHSVFVSFLYLHTVYRQYGLDIDFSSTSMFNLQLTLHRFQFDIFFLLL